MAEKIKVFAVECHKKYEDLFEGEEKIIPEKEMNKYLSVGYCPVCMERITDKESERFYRENIQQEKNLYTIINSGNIYNWLGDIMDCDQH